MARDLCKEKHRGIFKIPTLAQSDFTRAVLLRQIGSHSGLILDANLNWLSKIPTRLLPALEVFSLNMIISRNITSSGILLSISTFPVGMNLLLLIQFLVTHLPSMMEAPWPTSLLEKILKCVILMGSRCKTVYHHTLSQHQDQRCHGYHHHRWW